MPRKVSFPRLPFINTSSRIPNTSPSPSPSSSPSPRSRQSPSPPPSSRPSLYQRRTQSLFVNRQSCNNSLPPLQNLDLPPPPFSANQSFRLDLLPDSRRGNEGEGGTDQECWEQMLMLQKEFHCYRSARMEAAVDALERGLGVEEVTAPSRFCLDLLNEQLRLQLSQKV